jgi:hypothetical protein
MTNWGLQLVWGTPPPSLAAQVQVIKGGHPKGGQCKHAGTPVGLRFSLRLRAQSTGALPFTSIGPAPDGLGWWFVEPHPTGGVGVYVLGSLYVGAFPVAWAKPMVATSATRFICLAEMQHTDHQGVQSGTDGLSHPCHAKQTGEHFF